VPQLAFFVGKGGVGKTTVSSAYAVHCARQKPAQRVILISTDPAHSIADVLQRKLRSKVSRVAVSRGHSLDVWQVDSTALFGKFLAQYREQILSVIDAGALFSRDDIAPLIDSALPGMAEVSGLLAVHEAIQSRRYDRIIVDTAPFGHTLRLFELPGHFQRFLSFLELAASRDRVLAAHFGGSQGTPMQEFLNEWQTLADALRAAFGKAAELFLVTTPQKFSLNESVRSIQELAKSSPELSVRNVVLNRAVVGRDACAVCSNNSKLTKAAKEFLSREFSGSRLFMAEDPGCPIVGVEGLARFGEHVFSGKALNLATRAPKTSPVRFRAVAWPNLDSSLSLVLGKGGVGKTTMSAALAVHSRMQHEAVIDICSVDPAPSLDDVFGSEVGDALEPVLGDPRLRACEMDAIALYRQWVRELRENIEDTTTSEVSGIHVDLSFERQLLSALLEIVPPGVDEVLAIFRIMDLLSRPRERVVIDMAPTGHALELLRMPERILAWTRPLLKTLAAHRTLAVARDAAVKVAQIGQRARELVSILGSGSAAKVYVVMLAEPLPDHETERLMQNLQQLSLSPKALFVNRVLFAEDVGKCRRCRRAMDWQHSTLMKLKQRSAGDKIYIVRNFPSEIAGKSALRALTGELWQLA
jgi:arsenite-transporting ATPase